MNKTLTKKIPGRILLVGEDNPNSTDPRKALVPYPAASAGARLARILGLSRKEYLQMFVRVNLCAQVWDREEAELAAGEILDSRPMALVLLGVRVTGAFQRIHEGARRTRRLEMFQVSFLGETKTLPLPHPSGRNLVWNDPSRAHQAREALAELTTAAP